MVSLDVTQMLKLAVIYDSLAQIYNFVIRMKFIAILRLKMSEI